MVTKTTMLKYTHLLTLALSLSALNSSAQSQPIVYGSQALNWNHFSMRKSGSGNQKAFTYSGINYSVKEANQRYVVQVQAYFDANQSWVVTSEAQPSLLIHEQKLFDLTELYARKMRADVAKLMNNKSTQHDFETLLEKVRLIYMKWNNELFKAQQRYNVETNNGKNKEAQDLWNKQIDEELEDYAGFAAATHGL
jgi:hypothetical protein